MTSSHPIKLPTSLLVLVLLLFTYVLAQYDEDQEDDDSTIPHPVDRPPPTSSSSSMHEAREVSKPYLLRYIQIGDNVTLPFSPVTAIICVVSGIYLLIGLTKSSTATAYHILLDDTTDESRKKLVQLKKDINNDKTKFEKAAREISKCPSGKQAGGSLGTFKQGSMVPPFDRVVFDPKSPVGEVLGPVQTQFGWHLIYIVERDEQRQLIM